jgi:hypothetical protein
VKLLEANTKRVDGLLGLERCNVGDVGILEKVLMKKGILQTFVP